MQTALTKHRIFSVSLKGAVAAAELQEAIKWLMLQFPDVVGYVPSPIRARLRYLVCSMIEHYGLGIHLLD